MTRLIARSALVALTAGLLAMSPARAGSPVSTSVGCSTYSVPGLDVAPVPVSTLTDGVPYVIVCTDTHGNELINQVFIYASGRGAAGSSTGMR